VRSVPTTRSSNQSHPFQAILPTTRTLAHKTPFIPSTSQLWNTLPSTTFPKSYNLSCCKLTKSFCMDKGTRGHIGQVPPLAFHKFLGKCPISAYRVAPIVKVAMHTCTPRTPRGETNCPRATSSKGPHNTQCCKVWGPHTVNQQ